MGIDVVNLAPDGGHRLLHTALGTFARRRNHVIAVRGGAVAGQLGNNVGAAFLRVFQFFQHHHAATAGNHETVTAGIEGAGSRFRRIVVFGGQRAHGIEHHGQAPVLFFTAAGEHDVLLASLDLFHRVTDAVGAGGTGRGHGVVHATDLVGGGEAGGHRAGHDAGDHIGPDALHAFLAHDVGGFHLA